MVLSKPKAAAFNLLPLFFSGEDNYLKIANSVTKAVSLGGYSVTKAVSL